METDWDRSAEAWIEGLGDGGDLSRRLVLDAPMRAQLLAHGAQTLLDVGCGEGRFCRMMAAEGLACTGIDPTERLLDEARRQDPDGTYVRGVAEHLPFEDGAFEAVVSYLSLIDIPDAETALAEMVRVLAPGGLLLIGNLQSFATATQIKGYGWSKNADGSRTMKMFGYLEQSSALAEWRGVSITNYHRPMAFYMQRLLDHGLQMVWFDEPRAVFEPGDPMEGRAKWYNTAPYLYAMAWKKPHMQR